MPVTADNISTGDPIETAVSWDHETGEIWIDTKRRGTATRLRKLGVRGKKDAWGYHFKTDDSKVVLWFKRPTESQKARFSRRLETKEEGG